MRDADRRPILMEVRMSSFSIKFAEQLFSSVKAVVASLTKKLDTTDALVADLDARLSRLEALEQQRRREQVSG